MNTLVHSNVGLKVDLENITLIRIPDSAIFLLVEFLLLPRWSWRNWGRGYALWDPILIQFFRYFWKHLSIYTNIFKVQLMSFEWWIPPWLSVCSISEWSRFSQGDQKPVQCSHCGSTSGSLSANTQNIWEHVFKFNDTTSNLYLEVSILYGSGKTMSLHQIVFNFL